MRVLILADDCNPEWPSLPIVGFKIARAIAERVDAVVVTHVRNRENIEKVGLGRAEVRYIDNEYIARPLYKFASLLRRGHQTGWTTAIALAYPSYLAFEWEAWKASRDELRAGKFDLVHRLTPMSPTLPSPIAQWSPVPFILGPLNGALKWPAAFSDELAREREWLSYVRNLYKFLPFKHSTYRRSAAVLAGFQHTIEDLPKNISTKIFNFPEIGVDREIFDCAISRPRRKQKTIFFAGRLVPYKLPQVLVSAFASCPALREHRLLIAGEGPERPALEALIRDNGLSDSVTLLGWKTQAELGALMREADIFAFPSIRELGAGVLVEAMACGLACVVVDYGAPGTLIDKDRGIKVALGSRDQLTKDLGLALESLVKDDQRIADLGVVAREHAIRFYSWEAKAEKTVAIYNWVLGHTSSRPDFWNS